MGFTESLVRFLFRGRVRMMERIGDAARLIGEGKADECLEILESMERRIPPYVGYLFFLTKGRAFDELRRHDEAEVAYTAAVFSKEGATEAHLHLAVLCGRLRRFDDSKAWLGRIREDEEASEALSEQADELEAMLEEVDCGERLEQIRHRARDFAGRRGVTGAAPEEALSTVDRWVDDDQGVAEEERDDLACWLGEVVVSGRGGACWAPSLAMEDSVVLYDDLEVRPFDLVEQRLSGDASLVSLVEI